MTKPPTVEERLKKAERRISTLERQLAVVIEGTMMRSQVEDREAAWNRQQAVLADETRQRLSGQ